MELSPHSHSAGETSLLNTTVTSLIWPLPRAGNQSIPRTATSGATCTTLSSETKIIGKWNTGTDWKFEF